MRRDALRRFLRQATLAAPLLVGGCGQDHAGIAVWQARHATDRAIAEAMKPPMRHRHRLVVAPLLASFSPAPASV